MCACTGPAAAPVAVLAPCVEPWTWAWCRLPTRSFATILDAAIEPIVDDLLRNGERHS